eukprot:scaffold83727_cov47-Prasinocladus_malaysianus.AAC.1
MPCAPNSRATCRFISSHEMKILLTIFWLLTWSKLTTAANVKHSATLKRKHLLSQAVQHAETGEEREVLEFLVDNMPPPDVDSLSPEFLAENVRLALQVRRLHNCDDSFR